MSEIMARHEIRWNAGEELFEGDSVYLKGTTVKKYRTNLFLRIMRKILRRHPPPIAGLALSDAKKGKTVSIIMEGSFIFEEEPQ